MIGDKGQENYTYTKKGSPLRIKLPKQPGTYELRYVMNHGRVILSSEQIVVE